MEVRTSRGLKRRGRRRGLLVLSESLCPVLRQRRERAVTVQAGVVLGYNYKKTGSLFVKMSYNPLIFHLERWSHVVLGFGNVTGWVVMSAPFFGRPDYSRVE